MPANVEIKATARDVARQRTLAAALADGPARLVDQRDTFFGVSAGRLKLREFADGSGELIHYDRPDDAAAKRCDYHISPVANAAAMRDLLNAALGVRGEVRKRRELFMVGRTRVHFDRVETLGDFIELEVVLAEGESDAAGRRSAEALMAAMEIAAGDLIAGAYIDMLDA